MSLGSIFVGLAIVVITVAYIARPFRAAPSGTSSAADSRTDKLIEAWIKAAPVVTPGVEDAGTAPETSVSVATPAPVAPPPAAPTLAQAVTPAEAVNFCPQCGRRVTADYRFCPGCGALLPTERDAPLDGAA